MTRRTRIAVTIAVLVGLQLAAVGIYVAVQRSRDASPAPGFASDPVALAETAPSITGTRADGSQVTLGWPAPHARLVHFWGTWCPPCIEELPSLLAFARAMRPLGVEVVAIAVDDTWTDIAAFFGAAPIPPEVVVETDRAAHQRLGVSTLPDTYLVDRSGRVLERYHGARDWSAAAARDHIRARLR
jgi:thiol-disulfide isomerase/thioredoxin